MLLVLNHVTVIDVARGGALAARATVNMCLSSRRTPTPYLEDACIANCDGLLFPAIIGNV